jgi:hypothetical protein
MDLSDGSNLIKEWRLALPSFLVKEYVNVPHKSWDTLKSSKEITKGFTSVRSYLISLIKGAVILAVLQASVTLKLNSKSFVASPLWPVIFIR